MPPVPLPTSSNVVLDRSGIDSPPGVAGTEFKDLRADAAKITACEAMARAELPERRHLASLGHLYSKLDRHAEALPP